MSQKQQIEEFIWSFINPNDEECGWIEFTEENTENLKHRGYEFDDIFNGISLHNEYLGSGLSGVIKLAEKEFNVKIEFNEIGGFDSPGYNIKCYAWACITKDGELYFDNAIRESY